MIKWIWMRGDFFFSDVCIFSGTQRFLVVKVIKREITSIEVSWTISVSSLVYANILHTVLSVVNDRTVNERRAIRTLVMYIEKTLKLAKFCIFNFNASKLLEWIYLDLTKINFPRRFSKVQSHEMDYSFKTSFVYDFLFETSFDATANIINRSLEIILNSISRCGSICWHSQNATNCQLTIASLSKTVNEIIMKIVSHNVNADKWQLISECQLHCILPLQLVN